jgi:hexosaminidase
MRWYSGRSEEVQYSQHWKKNSIHYENGDGSYLTKNECRKLAQKCRERGIEIIPECPTLSHSDYICLAYPEIAERQDDPYPDTYCPNHPKTYPIVFDILDEVIEVFHPKRINIGHDEFYTVGICPRCKDLDPAKIYSDDVHKINDYLKERGISTLMWAEKLLKARMNYNGYKIGGWYDECNCNGVKFQVPDMFRCADMLPDDVTYIHWYWEFGEHLDDEFHCRNFKMVFGNFSSHRCVNFRERIKRGVIGGIVSNWGSLSPEYMQRNIQYFALITTAYALTSPTYDSNDKDEVIDISLKEMHRMYLSEINNPITVKHCAHTSIKYKPFWCGVFITDEEYLLGHYKITYKNGETGFLPVKLGTNIGPSDLKISHASVKEAAYTTLPIETDDGCIYETAYENPNPGVEISEISYIPCEGKEDIIIDYTFDV